MKKYMRLLKMALLGLLTFIVMAGCKAENLSQKSINMFFLNNGCNELQISFFTNDIKFVFKSEGSFVSFGRGDDSEIATDDVAKVLSLVDSLRFNYSPSGNEIYSYITDENAQSEERHVFLMLNTFMV